MKTSQRDIAPWLLLPSIVLALSGVTLLAPHEAAQAAPPASARPAPATPADDDGDGDELLEHWSDPAFSHEERLQLGGMAVGFLILGAINACRRPRRNAGGDAAELPTEADFLKLDSPAASHAQPLPRKAA